MTRPESAIVITHGLLDGTYAKTAHGLLRGPSRYPVAAVVDHAWAGRDAGEVCGLPTRGVPVVASVDDARRVGDSAATVAIIGVATEGGVLPARVRDEVLRCADLGMTLINGLHQLLGDDGEVAARVERAGGRIIDIRRPPDVRTLRFWSGESRRLTVPRIAVLGTDCAVGKRTTAQLLLAELIRRGSRAAMIYTGQTGWLQGTRHGLILDATPNDFVCGELERAVLECAREESPDVILIEGQSSLRNPSGPCGAELLLGAGATAVILQHAPGRRYFAGLEESEVEIPSCEDEIALIERLGGEVLAVTLSGEHVDTRGLQAARDEIARTVACPVLDPVGQLDDLATLVTTHAGTAS